MASFKSKMVNFLIRNQHFLNGKFRKETFDMDTSITGFRDRCEKGAAKYAKIPESIQIEKLTVEGIHSEWLIPDGACSEKIMMYVHGGGYVSGSCNDHRGFVSKFARNTGVRTFMYEYRLAPEHPFPAALDDSVKMYEWLLASGFLSENIVIAGESAGGGLALALLLALKERKIDLPAATVAISPWTDLTCSGNSYKTKNKVSPAPLNSWVVFSRHYAGDYSADFHLISPLFGDFNGLPPILINAGENDELFDDSEQFFLKAKDSGVDIIFRKGEGMLHCYPLLAPIFPEATEAMDEIADFIRKHLRLD